MSLAYRVNVTTNTQLQAGNQEVLAPAISDYLNHQSGPLSGGGVGLAVGKASNFLGEVRIVRTDPAQALRNFLSSIAVGSVTRPGLGSTLSLPIGQMWSIFR